MKNKLLLSSLLSLSILTFSGAAKAQESADAIFTGTLSASIEVVKIQDGSATINPKGDLEKLINAKFGVTSSAPAAVGTFTTADVSGVATLASPIVSQTFIALTNGTPAASAINNALSTAPIAPDNPDVIAYQILVTPDGQAPFSFNASENSLNGTILTNPGTTEVLVDISSISRDGTFDANDSAGEYTAQMTLSATGAL